MRLRNLIKDILRYQIWFNIRLKLKDFSRFIPELNKQTN